MANQQPTVEELMDAHPVCCTPQDAIDVAARRMAEDGCGALPVVDSHRTRFLVGILTVRDIVFRVVAADRNPVDCLVKEAMTPDPVSLRPGATIHQCIQVMASRQVRRIPVVDDHGKLIGMATQADLARGSQRQPELERELVELLAALPAQPGPARFRPRPSDPRLRASVRGPV